MDLMKIEPKITFSESSFYKLFKQMGFKRHVLVDRSAETEKLLEYRLRFYQVLFHYFDDCQNEFCFFDWSSFSKSNFQQKAWSMRGEKAIKFENYCYCSLHFFGLLTQEKLRCCQFVKGSLSSVIVFNFLEKTLSKLNEEVIKRNRKLVLILDNSPMNHSIPFKNFAFTKKITVLYTPPNSSFVNPIEKLFAFFKTKLKGLHGISQ